MYVHVYAHGLILHIIVRCTYNIDYMAIHENNIMLRFNSDAMLY